MIFGALIFFQLSSPSLSASSSITPRQFDKIEGQSSSPNIGSGSSSSSLGGSSLGISNSGTFLTVFPLALLQGEVIYSPFLISFYLLMIIAIGIDSEDDERRVADAARGRLHADHL